MSKYPNSPPGQRGRGHNRALVALEILTALAQVERATAAKIAEDIDRHEVSVRIRLPVLIEFRLVREAGRLPRIPGHNRGIGPMTYQLHPRIRTQGSYGLTP